MTLNLSIIIPTLNAARSLAATMSDLEALLRQVPGDHEVIVSDGGSNDETSAIARTEGARVIAGAPGRGGQLRRGAEVAQGTFLLFLHADTKLDDNAANSIAAFMERSDTWRRAGYFRFALDDESARARRLERTVEWRCRTFFLPYGDQGLLIRRDLYTELGGFSDMPLMEDVDFIWRLKHRYSRRALFELPAKTITSAEKFRRSGYMRRSAKNLFCLYLFWIGIPPALIAIVY
ncbi:MAG: TIGR04283 family arsenosugar biosynthesis glycosyltransferase [Pseudomonadota bacterium]